MADGDQLRIALYHEDQHYECAFFTFSPSDLTTPKCPYQGQKLLSKVRMETDFSDEDRRVFKNMFTFGPTEELIDRLLKKDEIAFQFEKLIHPYNVTQPESYQKGNYHTLVSLLDTDPEIERIEMHRFLEGMFTRDNQVIEGVMSDEDVVVDIRACLKFQGNATRTQAFKRVREAVISEKVKHGGGDGYFDMPKSRKCKRATYKCGLWYLRKSKLGFSYGVSKQTRNLRSKKNRITKTPFSRYLRQRLSDRFDTMLKTTIADFPGRANQTVERMCRFMDTMNQGDNA